MTPRGRRSLLTMTVSSLSLRVATPADAARYAATARRTFFESYGGETDPAQMEIHLATNFSEPLQRSELEDAAQTVFVMEAEETWAGFVALKRGESPPCLRAGNPIQLSRIYVVREWQGHGVGKRLLEAALHFGREHAHDAIWLQVWTENHRARTFYERAGFVQVGTFPFKFGDVYEDDLVLSRRP